MALRDRLPMLLEMRKEHVHLLRANASHPSKDRTGTATASLQGTIRFIGVADFVISGDVDSFRHHLTEVADLGLQLLVRYDSGEEIDLSYVSMLRYRDIFNALAAGANETALKLGERIGGRPCIEKEHDDPFDRHLGYTLKALIGEPSHEIADRLVEFATICREPDNIDFVGYAITFKGIFDHDIDRVREGLAAIVEGHKNLVKRGGVFHGSEDELVSVWGVALANLACSRGMLVSGISPFIPKELVSQA